MQLNATFDEIVSLAKATTPLPPIVRSLTASGSTIFAKLDPLEVITGSLARIVAAAAGEIDVEARFAGFSHGVATFEVSATARGLPAHKLLPLLIDRVEKGIAENPAAAGLIEIRQTEHEPLVLIDVQKPLSARVPGMAVTALDVRDGSFFVEAGVEG